MRDLKGDKTVKEIYRLDEIEVSTLITPHDCLIKEIKRENDFLVFYFEDDISYHDSIRYFMPGVKSLIIRYHLIDICEIYYQRWNKLMRRLEYLELKKESDLFEARSQYLYQYVMYNQLIIKVWKHKEFVLSLSADYVEYDWIER